jgi:hypothetical protein
LPVLRARRAIHASFASPSANGVNRDRLARANRRGGRPCSLAARCAERAVERRARRRSGGRRRGERGDRQAGATVQGLQVPRAGQLEPRTSRDRQSRMDDAFPRRGRRHVGSPARSKLPLRRPILLPGRANPRFIVRSLKAEGYEARALYERRYCAHGEAENHIKECQLDLVRRPHLVAHDARQSTTLLAQFLDLC